MTSIDVSRGGSTVPRRTVTIPTGFDKAIRSYQAMLMRTLNRDVTYTEALNYVLLFGFRGGPIYEGGRDDCEEFIAFWQEGGQEREASLEEFKDLLDGFDIQKIKFDGILDSLPTGLEPNE
jgi:hypothetical protein